jgi:hypothetical protein
MRKLWKSKRIAIPLLIAVGMMLTVGVVYADLKATKVVYAWDIVPEKYSNSNVALPFNVWIPFWHQLEFDEDLFDPTGWFTNTEGPRFYFEANGTKVYYDEVSGCATQTGLTGSTKWEGVMEYGLYHVDTPPVDNGHGFVTSRDWELVHCDRDGVYTPTNKVLDNADLAFTPPSTRTTILTDGGILGDGLGGWNVLNANDVVACTTGNCKYEIVTTIFVSLDMDCDGYVDVDSLRAGRGYTVDKDGNIDWPAVCFFAEALSPPPDPPVWGGQLQARIGTADTAGDKTVNFNLLAGGTAIELTSFTGRSAEAGSQPVILWAAIAVVGVGTLGALIWRLRPVRR